MEDPETPTPPDRVRVVQFGACAPTAGWEAGFVQHRLRRAYWNALCEIERAHREAVQAIVQLLKDAGVYTKDAYARPDVQALDLARKAARLEAGYTAARGGLFWTGYTEVERAMEVARRGLDAPRQTLRGF